MYDGHDVPGEPSSPASSTPTRRRNAPPGPTSTWSSAHRGRPRAMAPKRAASRSAHTTPGPRTSSPHGSAPGRGTETVTTPPRSPHRKGAAPRNARPGTPLPRRGDLRRQRRSSAGPRRSSPRRSRSTRLLVGQARRRLRAGGRPRCRMPRPVGHLARLHPQRETFIVERSIAERPACSALGCVEHLLVGRLERVPTSLLLGLADVNAFEVKVEAVEELVPTGGETFLVLDVTERRPAWTNV